METYKLKSGDEIMSIVMILDSSVDEEILVVFEDKSENGSEPDLA